MSKKNNEKGNKSVIVIDYEEYNFIKEGDAKALQVIVTTAESIPFTRLTKWFEEELDIFIEQKDAYGSGYMLQKKLEQMAQFIAQLSGKNFDDAKKFVEKYVRAEFTENTKYNKYDEGYTEGTVWFIDRILLQYSCHDDGYAFSANFDTKDIKAVLEILIAELGMKRM